MAAHTDTAGALNLYARKPSAFAEADLSALRILAGQATGAIALAQRIAEKEQYAADLQAAMASRTIIDQAIGVIMGQQRCPADQAFALLRQASQHRNIKLCDLCAEMLTSIGGQSPSDGGNLPPRA